jgi:hypothetical protein
MEQTLRICKVKRRDFIAKDLRTPKYRMRVVGDKRRKEPKHKGRLYDVS